MNPPATYDWSPEAMPCHNPGCEDHGWHSLPCAHCTCETSTEAQRLIIPRLSMPRMWAGDNA